MSRHSPDQLKRALKISEQIQKLEAKLASILGSTAATPTTKRAYTKKGPGKKKRKKTKISPEGLANIRAAQKKRWAKQKKEAKKAK
jgi:hypothetical protein